MGKEASRCSAKRFFEEKFFKKQEINQKLLKYIDTRNGMRKVADTLANAYFIRYFTREDMLNIVRSTLTSSTDDERSPRLISETVVQFILQPPNTAAGAIYSRLFPDLPEEIWSFAKKYPKSNVTKSIIEKLQGTYTAEQITAVLNSISPLANLRNEETDEAQETDSSVLANQQRDVFSQTNQSNRFFRLADNSDTLSDDEVQETDSSVLANQQRKEYSDIIDTIEFFQLKKFLVDEIKRLPKISCKSVQFSHILSELNKLTEYTEDIIEEKKQEVKHIAAKHRYFTCSFLKRLWPERRSPKSLKNFYQVFSRDVVVPEKNLSGKRL